MEQTYHIKKGVVNKVIGKIFQCLGRLGVMFFQQRKDRPE